MRTPSAAALIAASLILAACGGGAAESTTTTEVNQSTIATTTTTTSPPQVESMQLRYALVDGTVHEYEVGFEIAVQMTVTGDASMMMEAEDFPGELDVVMTGTTSFTYEVADGPEPGTYEVTITGEFSDVQVEGTANGEPVDTIAVPELAEMDPVHTTVIVDEQGNVLGDDSGENDLFGGGFGDFMGPGADLGRFIGPPMPTEEVEVGSTWTETIETPFFMGDPIVTEIDSEVTDIDADGVFHIETETRTSEVSVDMAAFLIGMFEAFVPEEATEEELAELETLKEQLRFLFSIDEAASNLQTRFDPSLGLATDAVFSGSSHVVMDVNMPDEETGELVAFALDMAMTQNVTYRLAKSSGA